MQKNGIQIQQFCFFITGVFWSVSLPEGAVRWSEYFPGYTHLDIFVSFAAEQSRRI